MTNTTNYNLNIVEGTDIVNPLTQFNPNFNTIDSAMKANSDAAVSPATCIKSGTVHTIVRSNTDAEMFVFTATGDWVIGDTMTVDGTPVTPVLPDGTALLDGSYLINAEVLASIKGSKVTIYSNKVNFPTITAEDVEYSAGVSVKDMLDSETIMVSNLNPSINYAHVFRIGNLVVVDFFCAGITANSVLFTLPASIRPANSKSMMQWMPTDSSLAYGSKTFTLISSNGNMICDQDVYRGSVTFIYCL